MDYRDFTLRIVAADSGYRAEVLDSPAGERAACTFELPFARGELAGLAGALGRAVRASGVPESRHLQPAVGLAGTAPPDMDDVGRRLSEALFQGSVRDQFLRSAGAHPRLRVRLRFNLEQEGVACLHRVPWELLVSPVTRRPLALSRDTPLVRFLEVARAADQPPAPETLEVCLVAAQPARTERLDLVGEERSLRAALGGGPVRARTVQRPTLAGIVEALQESDVHVLHVMGHADVDPATGEGVLLLEDDVGRVDPVTAHRFVTVLGSLLQPLRLVFLNACRTAEASEKAPLAGFAPALVEEGLPAVVAMQHPVTDGAAALFAGTVYGRLAAGAPIDEAVTEGRIALWDARGRTLPDLPEWATPALFLRVADGRLVMGAAAPPDVEGDARRRGRPWIAGLAAAGVLAAGVAGVTVWSGRLHEPASEAGSPSGEERGADPVASLPLVGEPEAGASSKVPAELQAGDEAGEEEAESRKVPADFQAAERPAGKRSEEGDASEVPADRELSDGGSAYFEAAGATVTADFLEMEGEPFVRLSVLPAGGTVQRQTAVGPETLEFAWEDEHIAVHVLHVDWSARTVRLRLSR